MIPLAKAATPAAHAALLQANDVWPHRDRASDGLLPSITHLSQNPDSDHNSGYAFDLTTLIVGDGKTPDGDTVAAGLVQRAKAGDSRIKYVIWDRHIWSRTYGFVRQDYSGPAHTEHVHVSIEHGHGNDTSPWWAAPEEDDVALSDAEKNELVKEIAAAVLNQKLGRTDTTVGQVLQRLAGTVGL